MPVHAVVKRHFQNVVATRFAKYAAGKMTDKMITTQTKFVVVQTADSA